MENKQINTESNMLKGQHVEGSKQTVLDRSTGQPDCGASKHQTSIISFSGGCIADFKKLKTTADYESVVRNSVNGVPEHWIPEVAKQCVDSSPSPQGRRHALLFLPPWLPYLLLICILSCEMQVLCDKAPAGTCFCQLPAALCCLPFAHFPFSYRSVLQLPRGCPVYVAHCLLHLTFNQLLST